MIKWKKQKEDTQLLKDRLVFLASYMCMFGRWLHENNSLVWYHPPSPPITNLNHPVLGGDQAIPHPHPHTRIWSQEVQVSKGDTHVPFKKLYSK